MVEELRKELRNTNDRLDDTETELAVTKTTVHFLRRQQDTLIKDLREGRRENREGRQENKELLTAILLAIKG